MPHNKRQKTLEFALSIDIGGTFTKLATVSPPGVIVARHQFATPAGGDEGRYVRALLSAIDYLLETDASSRLSGIGVGAPSANGREGYIEGAVNLGFEGKLPIRQLLTERYRAPAYLIKDSSAAALGEHLYGGARRMSNFILLTLGTGLGSALFLNGAPFTGHSGLASELGHVTVDPQGRQCACGRLGCLETYASATGIKRTIFQLLAEHTADSVLRDYSFDAMSAQHIAEAALRNDSVACQAFEFTGRVLGRMIANLAAFLEPEAVFLSGGLVQAGKLLLEPAARHFNSHVLHLMKDKVKILPSQLGANDAALLGAAALVMHTEKVKII
jgi:glucokinase